jgi:hypothetical protein
MKCGDCVVASVWWRVCGGECVVASVCAVASVWWRVCGGECVVASVWWRVCGGNCVVAMWLSCSFVFSLYLLFFFFPVDFINGTSVCRALGVPC